MKSLLIVYHSQSGASAALARCAALGAREEAVAVRFCRAWDAGAEEVAGCNGLLLVAAENSGHLNGGMKDFLDRIFYPTIDRGLVLPYGLVLSAGNDGRGAAAQAERILSGIPFRAVAEPLILRGQVSESFAQQARDLGRALAAGITMGIY